MVIDLQDVDATLAKGIPWSQIRLLGSSSQHLSVKTRSPFHGSADSDDKGSGNEDGSQVYENWKIQMSLTQTIATTLLMWIT